MARKLRATRTGFFWEVFSVIVVRAVFEHSSRKIRRDPT